MNDGLKISSEGPEFLLYLVHHSASVLREAGVPAESAKNLSITIATRMAEQCGGHKIYFPKGTWNGRGLMCFKLQERDWKIYHSYDGTNREDVCTEHKISTQRLYQIIAACRQKIAEHRAMTPPNPSVSAR